MLEDSLDRDTPDGGADGTLGFLDHLADVPNLITVGNLALGVVGIMAAIAGATDLAVIALAWCVYLDFADGRLARDRFQGPPHRRAYGRELDSFADLVAFSVASGLLIFCTNDGALVPALIGLFFAIFGCIRLAYFNIYNLDDGCFRGIPTTYAGFLVAVVYAVGFFTLQAPLWVVNVLCVAIGCAQVAPVRVPKLPLSLSAVFALALVLSALVIVQMGAL